MPFDSNTALYGIFGNPVMHSKSPVMHNFLFNEHKINAVYSAFQIDDLKLAVQSILELGIKGVSVTIPFKENVMQYLDWIDPEAVKIGAVNTILNKNGKLKGYNTDYKAAIEPLKAYGIQNKNVLLIGAGGAAQAIAFGVDKEKGNLFVANRSKEKGKALALKYSASFCSLSDIKHIEPDIIINTTSVGMTPDIDASPFDLSILRKEMIVMDIIYTPLHTKLLKHAKNKDCITIDGLSMFIQQGSEQFKLWTGIKSDIDHIKKYLINRIT